jgi:hypothetical protein
LPYLLDESFLPALDAFAAPLPVAAHVALEPCPPPVEQVVLFAVALVGFTPDWAPEFWAALPLADWVAVPLSLPLPCPWAFAEFPGAAWEVGWVAGAVGATGAFFPFPLPSPLPLPARADPVNAAMLRASKIRLARLAIRLVICFLVFESNSQRGLDSRNGRPTDMDTG